MSDGCCRIWLKAPPVDGLANAELIRWLSKQFGASREGIGILTGMSSRCKTVRIKAPSVLPEWYNE